MNYYKNACGSYKNANGQKDLGLMMKDVECQCITSPCQCGSEKKPVDVTDSVKDGSVDFFESVKGGVGKVWTFTKDTAEDVIDEVKEQKEKLDKKERFIKSVPNSLLVFGMVGLLAFSLIKK